MSSKQETAANSFKHFWDDDIVSEQREEMSINRRKTLLAFAEATREHGEASKEAIMKYSKDYGITETIVETTLRDFVSREVLTLKESVYMPHVRFFGKWLVEIGIGELINTLPIIDPVLAHKKEQEEATISSKEIVDLAGKWGNYRGRAITEDRIRAWLSQFGSPENQRLMFKMPLEISFYSRVFAVR